MRDSEDLSYDEETDREISEIERLLLSKGNKKKKEENMHKALCLSINKMKQYHHNEKRLTKKVDNLENRLNNAKHEGTSRFGTGKLISNLDDEVEYQMSDFSTNKL